MNDFVPVAGVNGRAGAWAVTHASAVAACHQLVAGAISGVSVTHQKRVM